MADGGRVLVLLQHDDEAEMVARLLASTCGYEVALTTDPEAALNHLPGSGTDGMVVGMELGRERAPRIIARVRALRDPASTVPVVVVADTHRRTDRLRAWEAGADGMVTKPFHFDELVQTLQTAMQRSSKQREVARHEAVTSGRQD